MPPSDPPYAPRFRTLFEHMTTPGAARAVWEREPPPPRSSCAFVRPFQPRADLAWAMLYAMDPVLATRIAKMEQDLDARGAVLGFKRYDLSAVAAAVARELSILPAWLTVTLAAPRRVVVFLDAKARTNRPADLPWAPAYAAASAAAHALLPASMTVEIVDSQMAAGRAFAEAIGAVAEFIQAPAPPSFEFLRALGEALSVIFDPKRSRERIVAAAASAPPELHRAGVLSALASMTELWPEAQVGWREIGQTLAMLEAYQAVRGTRRQPHPVKLVAARKAGHEAWSTWLLAHGGWCSGAEQNERLALYEAAASR